MEQKTVLTPDDNFYKHMTINNLKSKINTFRKYLSNDIPLSNITYQWCEGYKLYLLHAGYARNSISNIFSVLKAFIKRMHLTDKMKYDGAGILTRPEITTAVFTSVDEIKKLLDINLSQTPGIERIRDIYVCQCFLGLRVGDMIKFVNKCLLYLKEINGVQIFEIPTNKTGEIVVIPASKIVLDICHRRNFDFGTKLTQQYYYQVMKQIIKMSDFDRPVIFIRTEGGERVNKEVMFSSLVGPQTASRSFATNSYLAGVPVLDIMKIPGNKSFNSFYRYIRCENTSIALRLSQHEFFNLDFNQ